MSAGGEPPRTGAPWIRWLGPLVAAVVVYAPNLDDDFVSDDYDHPYLTGYSWSRLLAHLTAPSRAGEFFRPVGRLSMALDRLLFDGAPEPSHAVNVLIHAGCALLVGAIGARLTRDRRVGALAGVLFAAHPIHPEAVAFLGARFDLVAALFGLAAILAFLIHLERGPHAGGGARWLVLHLACFALAIGAKESALPIPLLLVPLALRRRPDGAPATRSSALAGFAVLGLYAFWRVFVIGDLGGYEAGGASRHLPPLDAAWLREVGAFVAYGLVTPVSRAVLPSLATPLAWILGLVSVLVLPFAARRREDRGALAWGLAFAVIVALPASSLFSTWGLVDRLEGARFLYLASAGWCVALALGLARVTPPPLRLAAVGLVATLYGGLTVAHGSAWSHASELARRTLDTILTRCDDLEGEGATVLVADPPDGYRGAFLWRNGLGAAVRQLHPAGPDARFLRAELEPDFYEPEGFDLRDYAGEREVCLFRWDPARERLEDRTAALRAARPPDVGAAALGWGGWTAFGAQERERGPERWVLDAEGDDPHVVSPPVPLGARALSFEMTLTPSGDVPEPLGEIWWATGDAGFDSAVHHRLVVVTPDGAPHRYRFALPLSDPAELGAETLRVRIDPSVFPARIELRDVRIE